MKLAEDEPAGTVTEAGGAAKEADDDRATAIPPAGALPVSDTVPVDEFPPTTAFGFRLTPARAAVVKVKVADAFPPFA